MKIALTGNLFPWGPSKAYGGERVIGYLADALARRGHQVVYFGTRQTEVGPGIEHVVVPHLDEVDRDPHVPAAIEWEERNGDRFDVFHCCYFGERWDKRALERWNYCELVWCDWCHIKDQLRAAAFNTVAYSLALQRDMAESNRAASMIHYGIPLDDYAVQDGHSDYVAWVGKIEGGKGVEWAIDVARAAGFKIVLMGPAYNPGYFQRVAMPHIKSGAAIWLKGCTDAMKARVFGRAAAFLSANVNGWREHLGIVNLEALAAGCPILAWSRATVPSAVEQDGILVEGVNGRLLRYGDSTKEYGKIVERGAELLRSMVGMNRPAVRATVEKEWSSDRMAARWEWFYGRIQNGRRISSVTVPESV